MVAVLQMYRDTRPTNTQTHRNKRTHTHKIIHPPTRSYRCIYTRKRQVNIDTANENPLAFTYPVRLIHISPCSDEQPKAVLVALPTCRHGSCLAILYKHSFKHAPQASIQNQTYTSTQTHTYSHTYKRQDKRRANAYPANHSVRETLHSLMRCETTNVFETIQEESVPLDNECRRHPGIAEGDIF